MQNKYFQRIILRKNSGFDLLSGFHSVKRCYTHYQSEQESLILSSYEPYKLQQLPDWQDMFISTIAEWMSLV